MKWNPQQAFQSKVIFVEDLMVIGMNGSYIYNPLPQRQQILARS